MDFPSKSSKNSNGVNASILSSNHKVIHYLQNSTHCSTTNDSSNSLIVFPKPSELSHVKDPSKMNPNSHHCQHRLRSCSDNSSPSSVFDTLSRSDHSLGSSLSDPGGHFSIFSSNTSSSGICSTSSDVGQEEGASTSSEDLDFNLGFDQISDNDDIEIANLNEIDDNDEHGENQDENHRISNENNDTATLLDTTDSNIDARISELEELLRNSYDDTNMNDDDYPFNNDDTITSDRMKKQQRPSFLHDSTHTLCPQDRFSDYSEEDEHENEAITNGIGVRSNSLGIVPKSQKSVLLDKPPKKVVRFADMLGLDLESIRYMTPPDQSTNSLIQECIRIKLEQLRFAKNQSNFSSSPLPFDLPTTPNRSISSSPSISSPKKSPKQYNLVSKYFTPPTEIIPLIYQRQILLECLYTKDAIAYGTVRVHNCAYDKYVFARITDDDWITSQDIQAWHSMNHPNDNTDAFVFEIRLGKYNDDSQVPKQIYFAVCLQAMCQEFWDNNRGWNYVLEVFERR